MGFNRLLVIGYIPVRSTTYTIPTYKNLTVLGIELSAMPGASVLPTMAYGVSLVGEAVSLPRSVDRALTCRALTEL